MAASTNPLLLSDPGGASALGAAIRWIEGTALGSVATVIAILAIAAIGFAMLGGRIDVRRGGLAVFGCFLLFGAAGIAAALVTSAGGKFLPAVPFAEPELQDVGRGPPRPAQVYDPYAGASVPDMR